MTDRFPFFDLPPGDVLHEPLRDRLLMEEPFINQPPCATCNGTGWLCECYDEGEVVKEGCLVCAPPCPACGETWAECCCPVAALEEE